MVFECLGKKGVEWEREVYEVGNEELEMDKMGCYIWEEEGNGRIVKER